MGIAEDNGDYKALAKEIAAVAPKLRYLKLDGLAWRIWRDDKNEGEDRFRLEELDRFEERAVQAFKSQRSFHISE